MRWLLVAGYLIATSAFPDVIADAPASTYRLIPTDDFTMISLQSGKNVYLKISDFSNRDALRALKSLHYSIFIASTKVGSRVSPIYLSGQVGDRIPGVMAGKYDEGTPEMYRFVLRAVIVHIPYVEYPDGGPELDPNWAPKVRRDLKASDFRPPFDADLIHHNEGERYFWVGEYR